jgi:hypothetical protein
MATTLPLSEHDPVITLLHSESEPCPEGSVPLHQLCDRCTDFVEGWDIVNWKLGSGKCWADFWKRNDQTKDESTKDTMSTEIKDYKFCYVEHLLQSQGCCHLCMIVLSSLPEESKSKPMAMVILSAVPMADYGIDSFPLRVQIGETESEYCKWETFDSPFLFLRTHNSLSCPSSCTKLTDRGVAGEEDMFDAPKLVHNVPQRSTDNLNQIKQWLEGCSQHHHTCSTWNSSCGSNGKYPTRIIQITLDGVRLVSNTSTIRDLEYLTLSHIWGTEPSQQLRLLSSRVEEFENAIPLEELPRNFRGAIRIVRYLGYRHLWIDSICIIQDSVSDWTAEAAKMSAVYSNAVCNLAFVLPPTMGFDQIREDPRCSTPCIIRRGNSKASHISISPLRDTSAARDPKGYVWLDRSSWPWSSQAWIFQEYLLSRRTIMYGHQNLMWEGSETFSDELLGSWVPDYAQNYHLPWWPKEIVRKSHLSNGTKILNGHLSSWWELVEDYRSRHLSKASDRIMAFAGVAEAFQNVYGLTYLAGIWKESLPYDLSWSVSATGLGGDHTAVTQDADTTSMPSWSWFRFTISKSGNARLHHNYPRYYDTTLFSAELLYFQWVGQPPNLLPQTFLYNFSGLQLSVRLALLPAKLHKQDILRMNWEQHTAYAESFAPEGRSLCYTEFEEQVKSTCSDLHPRGSSIGSTNLEYRYDHSHYEESPPDSVVLALLVEELERPFGFPSGRTTEVCRMTGIGLEPGEKHGTWRRVGSWKGVVEVQYFETTLSIEHEGRSETGYLKSFNGFC